MSPIGEEQIFKSASHIAISPEDTGSWAAIDAFSPIDITSPFLNKKSLEIIEQSATGTCHGPINWSCTVRPPTDLSPIVIKNCFDATEGKDKTFLRQSSNLKSL